MKSLVIYDSYFGNTQKIAELIASQIDGQVLNVKEFNNELLNDIELLIVGSPTRAFSYSDNMKIFFKDLNQLKNVKIGAFDSRMDVEKAPSKLLKFLAGKFGFASEKIEKQLVKKGGIRVLDPIGFYVKDVEGPLEEGELEKAKDWVREIK